MVSDSVWEYRIHETVTFFQLQLVPAEFNQHRINICNDEGRTPAMLPFQFQPYGGAAQDYHRCSA